MVSWNGWRLKAFSAGPKMGPISVKLHLGVKTQGGVGKWTEQGKL